jgi:16S rRNA (uracil1498-N3)-methyltransferase
VNTESATNCQEKQRSVILLSVILKKQNFELMVAKATEIGISKIISIIIAQTVKLNFNRQRLEKIIKGSVEQLSRLVLPVLLDSINFSEAVDRHLDNSKNNFIFLSDGPKLIWQIDDLANILIGPEGGFNDNEIKQALDNGLKPAGLGPFTLRA